MNSPLILRGLFKSGLVTYNSRKESIDAKIGNHQLPLLTNYENALTLLASSYDELITRFQSITGETSDSAIINTNYLSELKSKAAGIFTDSQMINSDANRIYSSISDIIPLSSADRQLLSAEMERYGKNLNDLANPKIGDIAKVFGQGGGKQIQFETSVKWYEKMGLLKEID